MTLPSASAAMPDLAVRQPASTELERFCHLFGGVKWPEEANLLGAVRSRPVERFVGVAAWWPVGDVGLFRLACAAGGDRKLIAGRLIDGISENARAARLQSLQCAYLLTDDSEWVEILKAHGFECARSERSFEILYKDAWDRIMRIHERHHKAIPAAWRAVPIRLLSPEVAIQVAGEHRLLPPDEIRAFWKRGTAGGFTLDLSCILFDGDRPFGAFLARRMGDVYYVDVQVVREQNPRLRSLGDLYMMYRMFILHDAALREGKDVPIRWLRFRSGEIEHRQTANLAFRMGGRELPSQRVMAKGL